MPLLTPSQPIKTTGKNLVGLWRPSFVRVDHRLFVYGGGGNVTSDLHVLNLCDLRWETIQTVKGSAPCKRYGHTATLWKNFIVVFGGCNEFQEYCNDVHLFDLQKSAWVQPNVSGTVPARYLHSAAVFDDKLFVYGGFAKNSECTYVLDELSVLDLRTFTWSKYQGVPPRYNHSATLVGHKMYIYAGKDEHGNTVSDLFVVNLTSIPYTPHLVLSGSQSTANSQMVLLKSQHFCEAVCGKLIVFGRYLAGGQTNVSNPPESQYGLWMLDLDTLEWQRQECNTNFEVGGWNYFTIVADSTRPTDEQSQATVNNLVFLGNTDPFRPQGYDHFRDALIINGESLGLYDIPPLPYSCEFAQLLDNPELSDFVIVPSDGKELHVHQVILITRWPHFRNIYHSGMMEAQQKRMEIPEPYEVVLAFLKYLYSDRLDEDEPWQIVCDVLVIANMYLLNRLKKVCCERLYRRHLTVETCGLVFEKAIMAEEMGLKLLALDFMFRNYGAVLKGNVLLQMPEAIRHEFLAAVPDEAVLEVSRSRSVMANLSRSSSAAAAAAAAAATATAAATAASSATATTATNATHIPSNLQQVSSTSLIYTSHPSYQQAQQSSQLTPSQSHSHARLNYIHSSGNSTSGPPNHRSRHSAVQTNEIISSTATPPPGINNTSSSMSVGV